MGRAHDLVEDVGRAPHVGGGELAAQLSQPLLYLEEVARGIVLVNFAEDPERKILLSYLSMKNLSPHHVSEVIAGVFRPNNGLHGVRRDL